MSGDKIVLENGKYTFELDNGHFTRRRYDGPSEDVYDKGVLCLFFKTLELQERVTELERELADSFRSEDLPDLLGSNDTVISLEETDVV